MTNHNDNLTPSEAAERTIEKLNEMLVDREVPEVAFVKSALAAAYALIGAGQLEIGLYTKADMDAYLAENAYQFVQENPPQAPYLH